MSDDDPLATPSLGLIGIQRAAFERAGHLQNRSWLTQVALALITCVAVFVDSYPLAIYALTVLAFFGTMGVFYLSSLQRACRENAERARRASLLVWGLGKSIPSREYAEIRKSFQGSLERARQLADRAYFASKLEVGYPRFAQMLEENAFWTSNLARASSRHIWGVFAVVCILAGLTLFAALGFGDKGIGVMSAKVVCAILTLWISAGFLEAARSLRELSLVASDVDLKIQALKGQPDNVIADHVFFMLGDYNFAVESSPMFSSSAFKKSVRELNELWAQRMSNSAVW